MLRAFDYVENSMYRSSIQDTDRFNQELKLAKKTVERILQMETRTLAQCPGCGSRNLIFFFSKWGVNYLRCEVCGSIFAEASSEVLTVYQSDEALCQYRHSAEYQKEAMEKRMFSWQELLDWIIFRSYRYLRKWEGLRIVSGGDRYTGFAELIKSSPLCGSYCYLEEAKGKDQGEIALSLNLLQQTCAPKAHLTTLNQNLKKSGLLFMSARIGTGFDIMVLKEYAQIYPYEYVTLLSKTGIEHNLKEAGFEILDYSTPGSMDVGYVKEKEPFISPSEHFVKMLMSLSDEKILGEFQRFLQKNGMSSYAHIVAKKVEER